MSVIIPIFNSEQNLVACLDSIINQSLRQLEIICVDDGSTDNTFSILKEYMEKDKRIQVIHQENAGPGQARNRGLQNAMGDYIIFLDSDDWFEPKFLDTMVQSAKKTNADIVICHSDEFDARTTKRLESKWMLKDELLQQNPFSPEDARNVLFQITYGWPWDKLYSGNFLRKIDFKYPTFRHSEDLVPVFLSLIKAKTIYIVSDVFVHHRVNQMDSVSKSVNYYPEILYDAVLLLQNEMKKLDVYKKYEKTFLNWAMEFLVWNIINIKDKIRQKNFLLKFKKEWILRLNFDLYPKTYYKKQIYYKYLFLKIIPVNIFVKLIYIYRYIKHI